VCVFFFSLSLTLSHPRNCSLEDPMLENGSSSQPKQKFERKQRRKQRRRDVRDRRKRSRITRLPRLLLLPAVQWHPAMPLGPPRLPPKKMPVTTPTPLNCKIRHAEKTRTKKTPELYCCYCCCYHPHNAASSCRRFPTHASATLLPAATCTLTTSFPD
jgi:hypothetical protein